MPLDRRITYWPGYGPFITSRLEPNSYDMEQGGYPPPPDPLGGPRPYWMYPGTGPNVQRRMIQNQQATYPIVIVVGPTSYQVFPGAGYNPTMRFIPNSRFETNYGYITGTTKDSNGNVLAGCTVKAYITSTDQEIGATVSDGAGFFKVPIGQTSGPYYLVAYKAGSPDVAGTTVNTLVGG